jgi:membrane-associated phospholipid phosphatase
MHLGKDIYVDKRDLRYLWYLPVYILAFVLIERVNIGAQYHEIHMFLDDLIPFSEYFIVPYLSWHVLTFVVIGWLLIRDPAVYRKMMTFFIVASILCFVIFLAYPSYQTLRPETFERHNLFTWAVSLIYAMDTPTNICPSMHVIGSLGLLLAVFETKEDMRMPVKTVLAMLVVFICASTMFLKQHSFSDVIMAVGLAIISYIVIYRIGWTVVSDRSGQVHVTVYEH